MRVAKAAAMVVCLAALPGRLDAQADSPSAGNAGPRKTPADSSNHFAIVTRKDLLFGAGLAAGTVIIAQFDRTIAQNLQDPATPPSASTHNTARAFNRLGIPGTFVISGGLYAAGLIGGVRGLADAGLHMGEALVLSEAATYLFKFSFGRERPSYAGTSNPNEFKFGRGLQGDEFASFPSGHAVAAFAAAAAGTTEVSIRWPHATIFVAPLFYGSAAMVGWARLETNAHWMSDVFFGAGLGTWIGIKTVRWNHAHPNNRLDRWLLPRLPTVTPAAGGVRLMWTVRPTFLE